MKPKSLAKHMAKKVLFSNKLAYNCFVWLKTLRRITSNSRNAIHNEGFGWIKKDIIGQGNAIQIGKNCFLKGTRIRIRGNNNKITFENDCVVGANSSFWMEGNDISIVIGSGTTFTHTVHFCAQENGVSIRVGKDCMFSNNIIVRTSDSHPIYDMQTNERINPAKDVVIGAHVWIAPNTKIMKGAQIGDGAIIGSDTMVSRIIHENSLAVGHPAEVVKHDVKWTREALF